MFNAIYFTHFFYATYYKAFNSNFIQLLFIFIVFIIFFMGGLIPFFSPKTLKSMLCKLKQLGDKEKTKQMSDQARELKKIVKDLKTE